MKKTTISVILILFSIAVAFGQQDTLIFKYRRMAVDYEQTVKMAMKGLEGANSLVESSKTDFLPKFDLDGNYKYFGNPIQLGETPGAPTGSELSHLYEMGLWVSQPIYTGGYLKSTKEMALSRSGMAQANIALSEQNTMLEADAYYLSMVAKKEISLLSIKYRDAIGQFQKVIQDRVDEEVVGMNELYQAKVRYNDAQYEVIKMEKEFIVGLMTLNRLIGVPLNTVSMHMDSLMVVNWKIMTSEKLDKALELRPEINIKTSQVSMNEANEKVKASFYKPQFNIGAGGTYGAPSPGLLTEAGANYHVTARLAIPIFYWGQKKDEVFAMQKITEQTQLELQKTVDMVTLQVTSGYYELERSQEQVDFSYSSLDNASKNVDLMVDRYYEGLSSVLEVLDAQLFWQKSYLNYIEAKFELNIAYSSYQKAMGELNISQ